MGDPFYDAYATRSRIGQNQLASLDEALARRVRRKAGNAMMGGDYNAAAGALYESGDLEGGTQVVDYGREQQAAAARAEAEGRKARVAGLGTAYRAMRGVPEAERRTAYDTRGRAALAQIGVPDEILNTMDADDFDWTDASWDMFGQVLGEEEKKYQVVQTGDGGIALVESVGDRRPTVSDLRAPTPKSNAPAGYRVTADGGLEFIPGGPADPRVVGTRAAAGRAPKRGGQARVQGGPAPRSYGSGPEPTW